MAQYSCDEIVHPGLCKTPFRRQLASPCAAGRPLQHLVSPCAAGPSLQHLAPPCAAGPSLQHLAPRGALTPAAGGEAGAVPLWRKTMEIGRNSRLL
eukprot:scaffold2870_cov267-Pinguiococcus_pyrenoidosus.AAC.7